MRAKESDAITLSVAPCIRKGIGVEIGKGCSNGCIYCFSGCVEGVDSKQKVSYFDNVAEIVESFLKMHASEVENVHLGYVTDFFQDGQEADRIRKSVLSVLQKYPVNISCLTKGFIHEDTAEIIETMGNRFTLMIDTGCGDLEWESNVMPLGVRLYNVRKMTKTNVNARIDPIIPTVNDGALWFRETFKTLATAGIKNVDCSFLFLTDEVMDAVEQKMGIAKVKEIHNLAYNDGCNERLNGAVAWTGEYVDMEDIRYKIDTIDLPSPDQGYRQGVLSTMTDEAAQYGIKVRLCNCKNRSMKSFTGFCSDSRKLQGR